ncbi:MAG: carbamoyltransferase family protein, partial [Blastocatellia bacterium]
ALARIPEKLAALGFAGQFHWIDHHAAHAASAYYVSPFQDAAILAIDGTGEKDTAIGYYGKGNSLEEVLAIPFPSSLGFLWEVVSIFLGFDIYDAAKVMGLAAYGNPQRFIKEFRRIIQLLPDGTFRMDNDLIRIGLLRYHPPSAYCAGLEELLNVPRREHGAKLDADHHDVAAAIQTLTDEIVMHIANHLHAKTGSANLCLAGGVALNCVSNSFAFEEGPFRNLYVQPVAQDGGTAIGAAYYIWNHLLDQPSRDVMDHAYWGPEYSDSEIEAQLKAHGLSYRCAENLEEEVALLISQDKIVAFFQGRMEGGPRALGNRSLLANPRNRNMRDILNAKVKHREYFRPLAPSVLAEEAAGWFTIKKPTIAADFMLMTYPVQEHARARIPAVIHEDGSSRIQTVRKETNPCYHKVISEFYKLTGAPVVLNTSFNDSEPIVCSPQDAINTFMKTEIDYLAIGNFIVCKAENRRQGATA